MDVYLACLLDAQQNSILNEIDVAKLLLNVKELYIIHLTFWKSTFLPLLNDVRISKDPFSPEVIFSLYNDMSNRFQNYGSKSQ